MFESEINFLGIWNLDCYYIWGKMHETGPAKCLHTNTPLLLFP